MLIYAEDNVKRRQGDSYLDQSHGNSPMGGIPTASQTDLYGSRSAFIMITRNSKYGVFGNTTMSGSKESEWQVAVALGKVLVSQYKDIRKQVVDLAKSVCVIHHGGKSVDERYTLKSFAILKYISFKKEYTSIALFAKKIGSETA